MVCRGEIYFADLFGTVGCEQGGLRPVLVVQNNKGNKYSNTVIIAPISKRMSKPPIPTHVIFSNEHLDYVSMILLEQLRTIDKRRLKDKICNLDNDIMSEVNKALKISLGLNDDSTS